MRISHVLISRPPEAAAELATRVRDLGLQPVIVAPFRFVGRDVQIEPDAQWTGAPRRLAIFTSPRAVEFGLPRVVGSLLADARIAAVGPATRDALQTAGLEVGLMPEGRHDSEALLDALNDDDEPGAALVFAAPGGRKALRDGLLARGWRVREALVYTREPLTPDAAAQAQLAGASGVASLWTSGQAMQQLLDALAAPAREQVLQGFFLVPSQRLREIAEHLGASNVRLSEGAGNDALMAALRGMLGPGSA